VKISLPWPSAKLSPNARLHWRAKVGPKQDAKRIAAWTTVAAQGFYRMREALRATEGRIALTVTFYPPDRRHRDDDNMIASFKAARDGIADALSVDDRRFRPTYCFGEPEKPGRVEVTFPHTETGGGFTSPAPDAINENGPDSRANELPGPDHNAKGPRQ
jgi:hypothetical protein